MYKQTSPPLPTALRPPARRFPSPQTTRSSEATFENIPSHMYNHHPTLPHFDNLPGHTTTTKPHKYHPTTYPTK